MAERWLTVIGMGEDGPTGLSDIARAEIAKAELVFAAPRHHAIAGTPVDKARDWPVPFDVAPLLEQRGRQTVVLASGDPFWFGAGGSLAQHLADEEWEIIPAPSTFSLAAARMGWRIEETACHGLHAAPFARLRPDLANGAQLIVLVRDGAAVSALAKYLTDNGFGNSWLWVMEALGGPRERIRDMAAKTYALADVAHPVTVAVEAEADGPNAGLSRANGLPDNLFAHDGQITRAAVRALTLAALAPRPGDVLWDIGAGSGSVSVEFLLSAPRTRTFALEPKATRAANIRTNSAAFGLEDRLHLIESGAPDGLAGLPDPQAVFLGGGGSDEVLEVLWARLRPGTRIVANAVTLETEAMYIRWQAAKGGSLLRFDLAEAAPLGQFRGWRANYPVVQWSVVR
ncbi:MAG: precorrin-6y C5,15-methyltransferase (decarboxylating) subunit CbiE [Paracoccaceae bacterium]